jgi:sugar phosphate isomerase/epimerase
MVHELRRKLSISTSFSYDMPLREQIPLIAEIGFTHISIGGNTEHAGYLTKGGQEVINDLLNKYSLSIDTIHGPRIDQEDSIQQIEKVTDAAVELSVGVIVVHCSAFNARTEELPAKAAVLLRVCDTLSKIAEKKKLRFAFENVLPGPATELIGKLLEQTNPSFFGFCYDSSHDQVGGPRPFTLLDEWSNRLLTAHLSDRIRDFVDHVIPGEGFIEWADLSITLRKSKLPPPLLMEVMMTHSLEKDPRRFLSRTYTAGCSIYDMVFG